MAARSGPERAEFRFVYPSWTFYFKNFLILPLDKYPVMWYNTDTKKGVNTMTDLLQSYEEYCVDCRYEGIAPKPFWAWLWEGEK